MMRLFMRHLELWLSAAGVAVILLRTVAHMRAMLRDDIHKQVAALLTVDARATKE